MYCPRYLLASAITVCVVSSACGEMVVDVVYF